MFNKLNRIVAILLIAALLCALLPVSVFADEGQDIEPSTQDVIVTTADPTPAESDEDISDLEKPDATEVAPAEELSEPETTEATVTETEEVFSDVEVTDAEATEPEEDVSAQEEEAPAENGAAPVPADEAEPELEEVTEAAPAEENEAPAEDAEPEDEPEPAPAAEDENEAAEKDPEQETVDPADGNVRNPHDPANVIRTQNIPTNTGNAISLPDPYSNYTFKKVYVPIHDMVEMNGKRSFAYCLNPERDSTHTTESYTESADNDTWAALGVDKQRAITLILSYAELFGISSRYEQVAVQIMIWEIVTGQRNTARNQDGTAFAVRNASGKTGLYRGTIGDAPKNWTNANYDAAKSMYDHIADAIAKHYTRPSFTSADRPSAPTYTMTYEPATGTYSCELTDTYGVLSGFNWSATGVTFSKNGNTMTVTATNPNSVENISFASDQAHVLENGFGAKLFETTSTHQDFAIFCSNSEADPIRAYFKLDANPEPSKMTMKKTTDYGSPEGYCFKLYNWNNHKSWYGVSDENGDVLVCDSDYNVIGGKEFDGLTDGMYTFVEVLSRHGKAVMFPQNIAFSVKDENGNPVGETLVFSGDDISETEDGDARVNRFNLTGLNSSGKLVINIRNATAPGTATMTKIVDGEGCREGFYFSAFNAKTGKSIFGASDEEGKIYKTNDFYEPKLDADGNKNYVFTNLTDGRYIMVERNTGLFVPEYIKVSVKSADGIMREVAFFELSDLLNNPKTTAEEYVTPWFDVNGLNGGGELMFEIKNTKPEMESDAYYAGTELKTLPADSVCEVEDRLTVYRTIEGHRYHTIAFPMNSEGYEFFDEENNRIEFVSDSFTGTGGDMHVSTMLTVDTNGMKPGDVIAIGQELYDETVGKLVAEHSDPDTVSQQLTVSEEPSMKTTATWQDGSKVLFDFEAMKVLERCNIDGKAESDVYKMLTILWDLDNDKAMQEKLSDAFPLTYGVPYVFETEFDVSNEEHLPSAMVVLEYLFKVDEDGNIDRDNPYLTHDDKTDENQTVKTATIEIRTLAQTGREGKFFVVGVDDEINDKVFVTVKGDIEETSYTFTGTLMEAIEKEDGSYKEAQILIDGKPVYVNATAILGPGETVVELSFKELDWEQLFGKHLVVYEDVQRDSDNEHVADHKDITDEGQSIYVPDAHTTATDTLTESHYAYALPETTTADEYHYYGLKKGETYVVEGFMNQVWTDENGNVVEDVVLLNGEPVTAYASFVAEHENGVALLYFTYPAVELVGVKTVVGERLYYNGVEINFHYDVNDREQTVTPIKPTLQTTATVDGQHAVYAAGRVHMIDAAHGDMYMTGNYKSVGQIMLKVMQNGKYEAEPLLVNGEPMISTVYFTVGESKEPQIVDVEIPFDAFDAALVRGLDTVVFEDVYWLRENEKGEIEEIHVVEHHDVNDEHQTVSFKDFRFHTVATVNGVHSVMAAGMVAPQDKIIYENGIAGTRLFAHAMLLERIVLDGKVYLIPFLVNGKQVESSLEFPIISEKGSVFLTFPEFDVSDMADRELVVVEEMYEIKKDGTRVKIGEEYDADNKSQTISFYGNPDTGDSHDAAKWYALLFSSMLGMSALVVFLMKQRKRSKKIR